MKTFSGLAGWEWEGPWEAEEWHYAPDWSVMSYPPDPSSRERNLVDFVRRKRWVRRRRRQQISPGAPLTCSVLSCFPALARSPTLLYSCPFEVLCLPLLWFSQKRCHERYLTGASAC